MWKHTLIHGAELVAKETFGAQGPRAVLTPFGWIVVGKLSSCLLQGPSRRRSIHFGTSQEVDVSLADTVQQFWSTESFGTNPDVRKIKSMANVI
ncbi:hypothetical protein GHT06_004516 [Daphnia sinensis]|uniref:Uncharacterized protein n=1 Tax=Daphnia sinensis TaxID=1820382 RepID=A0AAD5KVX5_9CRUS|nr:hypothetical protein GHT06_004516 [Daphnia sinensis]